MLLLQGQSLEVFREGHEELDPSVLKEDAHEELARLHRLSYLLDLKALSKQLKDPTLLQGEFLLSAHSSPSIDEGPAPRDC